MALASFTHTRRLTATHPLAVVADIRGEALGAVPDPHPPDFPKPNAGTLWRWLTRAVAAQMILVAGTGRKADPACYWLPGAEERWSADNPIYEIIKKQEHDLNSVPGSEGVNLLTLTTDL